MVAFTTAVTAAPGSGASLPSGRASAEQVKRLSLELGGHAARYPGLVAGEQMHRHAAAAQRLVERGEDDVAHSRRHLPEDRAAVLEEHLRGHEDGGAADAGERVGIEVGDIERAERVQIRTVRGVGYFFGAYDVHADVLFGGYRLLYGGVLGHGAVGRDGYAPGDDVNYITLSAGGGPAGMMAGLLFARAGVETLVLEKHADFLRDFRGDTLHPSTLEAALALQPGTKRAVVISGTSARATWQARCTTRSVAGSCHTMPRRS